MSKLEVKKCPFCGGNSVLWDSGNTHAKYTVYRVCCVKCHATQGDMVYYSEIDAVNAWNRRADNG